MPGNIFGVHKNPLRTAMTLSVGKSTLKKIPDSREAVPDLLRERKTSKRQYKLTL
jgi:hypothetical protein